MDNVDELLGISKNVKMFQIQYWQEQKSRHSIKKSKPHSEPMKSGNLILMQVHYYKNLNIGTFQYHEYHK